MNNSQRFFLWLLILLFVIAPFYSPYNIGGAGLAMTYNLPVWSVASWIMALGLLLASIKRSLRYPKLWLYFIAFPVIIIVSSLLAEASQPITWLFRQLYILGGLLFLLALFQFSAKQKTLDQVLLVIVIATGLHALLGSLQTFGMNNVTAWFPNSGLVPRGNFQQINVHVSFLVTGMMIGLYLISRPSFRYGTKLMSLIVVISFVLALYVIIASGSRVGLLALLMSLPLIIWSRFHQLKQHKKLLAIMLIASCGAVFIGQAGLHTTLDKTAKLSEKSYSTARVAMYTIGLELVAKEPIHGYGIGNFRKAWNLHSSDFVNRHPETVLPSSVNHPHNEILFWMIEGGLLSVAGIIAAIIGIILALIRCGFQRGGAYAAMLLPISLHTQVELPFYISAVHWFLWLFIIFMVLRHQTKTVTVNLSTAATRSIQALALFLAVAVTVFMINTARAQTELYTFLYQPQKAKQPYLQIALNNLYFKPAAERIAMRSMLYASIENNDHAQVEVFEQWALDYVNISPELKMYEDLISASLFLRPSGKGCDAISAGLAMYAHNVPLQEAYQRECVELAP